MPFAGAEALVTHWIIDNPQYHFALVNERQRDAIEGDVGGKVAGAVERVETPERLRGILQQRQLFRLGHLLAEKGVAGPLSRQGILNVLLHGQIGLGDEAAIGLVVAGYLGEARH